MSRIWRTKLQQVREEHAAAGAAAAATAPLPASARRRRSQRGSGSNSEGGGRIDLKVMAACSGDARSLGHTGCHVPPGPTGPLAPGHAVGSRAEGIVLGLFATTMDGIELSRLPRPPGEKPPVLNLIARWRISQLDPAMGF